GGDPRREGGGVEAGDRPDAAGAGQLGAEETLDGVPQGGDDAHAGDDDAPHAGSPLASSPLPWGERATRADNPLRFRRHYPPASHRPRTIAARWPRSVPASLSRHARRAAPGSRRTNTGHSGSVSSWLSVPGRQPSASPSTLAASSTALEAVPRVPKEPLRATTPTRASARAWARPRACQGSSWRVAGAWALTWSSSPGATPARARAARMARARPAPVRPRSKAALKPSTSA